MLKVKITDANDESKVFLEETGEAFIGSVIKKSERKNNGMELEQIATCIGNASPCTINRVLDTMSSQIKEQVNAKAYSVTEKLMKEFGVPDDKIKEAARKFVDHMDGVGTTTVSKNDTPPDKFV